MTDTHALLRRLCGLTGPSRLDTADLRAKDLSQERHAQIIGIKHAAELWQADRNGDMARHLMGRLSYDEAGELIWTDQAGQPADQRSRVTEWITLLASDWLTDVRDHQARWEMLELGGEQPDDKELDVLASKGLRLATQLSWLTAAPGRSVRPEQWQVASTLFAQQMRQRGHHVLAGEHCPRHHPRRQELFWSVLLWLAGPEIRAPLRKGAGRVNEELRPQEAASAFKANLAWVIGMNTRVDQSEYRRIDTLRAALRPEDLSPSDRNEPGAQRAAIHAAQARFWKILRLGLGVPDTEVHVNWKQVRRVLLYERMKWPQQAITTGLELCDLMFGRPWTTGGAPSPTEEQA